MSQKVAYVTGGMGGIGTSICQRLHDDGYKVIAGCGPSRDHAKWLAEQKALGYTFHASVGNVADWDSTVAAFKQAKEEHGPIDILVNNAGITRDRMFLKMSREDWDAVINTNLTSMFNVTKQVVADMVRAIKPEVLEKIVATIPVKRLGTGDEIASIVSWLAGDEAGFTTGAEFAVNGGLHMG